MTTNNFKLSKDIEEKIKEKVELLKEKDPVKYLAVLKVQKELLDQMHADTDDLIEKQKEMLARMEVLEGVE